MLPDGRILFTRWKYVDRSQISFHHLWTMNPDGTLQHLEQPAGRRCATCAEDPVAYITCGIRNLSAKTPLQPSGLLGPVRVMAEE